MTACRAPREVRTLARGEHGRSGSAQRTLEERARGVEHLPPLDAAYDTEHDEGRQADHEREGQLRLEPRPRQTAIRVVRETCDGELGGAVAGTCPCWVRAP